MTKWAPQMPSTQLQHCLHCRSVYPHKVFVEENNEHSKTNIVHLICENCTKCTICDMPPLDPQRERKSLSAAYFNVIGDAETQAFKHVVSLIVCNKELAHAMFDYLTASYPELRQN